MKMKPDQRMIRVLDVSDDDLKLFKIKLHRMINFLNVENRFCQDEPRSDDKSVSAVRAYWDVRDSFTSADNGLISKDDKIVWSTSIRKDMLRSIHEGHFGIRIRDVKVVRDKYFIN